MPPFVQRLYERFLKVRGTPREVALGMALGVMVGMTPTMGLQTIIAVFLASVCKWSKIMAAIGVQITNVFTAPLIYGLTYVIGAWIMGIQGEFDIRAMMNFDGLLHLIRQAPMILTAMTLGGLILGLPLAAASYIVTFWLVVRYRAPLKERLQNRVSRIGDVIRHPRTRKKRRRKK